MRTRYLWAYWGRDLHHNADASFGFGLFPKKPPPPQEEQRFWFRVDAYWNWLPPVRRGGKVEWSRWLMCVR
jgi:hypothetical protein